MKKIVRLTEADLARIVKRVIKENEDEDYDMLPPLPTENYVEFIEEVINNVVNLFEIDLENGHIRGTYDIDVYVNKMQYDLDKLFMNFMEEEDLSDETLNELEIIASDMIEGTVDYFYDTIEGMDFPDPFED
jgi:hypothetical protein